MLRRHQEFVGSMSPFLEIGANAGHTSYMLCNEFGAEGFALDLSADALRHGISLQEAWGMPRAPVRVAGDALNLPFQDNSLQLVMAYQMLSQFLNIETVFLEVKRVLKPGGVFVFAEEPIRRMLSLRLYRCAYYDTMKPWERKLFDWGLLGYLVKDVIGADQEESFGIRQNHRMGLNDWHHLVEKHFDAREYEVFVSRRGWGERAAYQIARMVDRYHSDCAARLLGGTSLLSQGGENARPAEGTDQLEAALSCPDGGSQPSRQPDETLAYAKCDIWHNEGGVTCWSADRKSAVSWRLRRPDRLLSTRPRRNLVNGWYDRKVSSE
jgi:SAM-dependent methyltransferase